MKKYKLSLIVILLLLVFLIIPRTIIVPQISQVLKNELSETLQTDDVQVKLGTPLGWELLFGRIPEFEIVAHNGIVDGFTIASINISGKNVLFDAKLARQQREYVQEGADSLQIELVVKEADLNEFFWREIDPAQILAVEVSPDKISLVGDIPFWNTKVGVKLHGHLEIVEEVELRFVPDNLEVQETRIPPFLLEVFNENYEFALDLGIFPYPVKIARISLLDQEVHVDMDVVQ